MREEARGKRIVPVVVVVDIDDDIGEVLGRSLLVGEHEIEKAVLEYGKKRPSDPDVNAMLAGLSIAERLKAEYGDSLIIAVGGHPLDYLEAQKNIKRRVESAVSELDGVPEFYIVSDGEDEFVISQVLRDIGRIGGFERVIVEQDLGIEGRYLLILKYIKKAMFEPRFSRYILGIPGIALAIFALISLIGLAGLALKATALVIGLAMIVRGFNLEDQLEASLKGLTHRIAYAASGLRDKPYLRLTGLLILLLSLAVSIYTGYEYSRMANTSGTVRLARILQTSIPVLAVGGAFYILVDRILYRLVSEEEDVWYHIMGDTAALIVTIFLAVAFYTLGSYMLRVEPKVIGLNVFLESGFLQFTIAGVGLAAIIETIRHVKFKANGQNSSPAGQTS